MKKYKLSDVLAARTNYKMLKDCTKEMQRLFKDCPKKNLGGRFSYEIDNTFGGCMGGALTYIYRISDNWPPAEQIEDDTVKDPEGYRIVSMADRERWLLNIDTKEIIQGYGASQMPQIGSWIEITPEQKAYLETKPEPEEGYDWVIKVPEIGEKYLSYFGILSTSVGNLNISWLNGIRWVRVPVSKKMVFEKKVTWTLDGEPFDIVKLESELASDIEKRDAMNKKIDQQRRIVKAFKKKDGK